MSAPHCWSFADGDQSCTKPEVVSQKEKTKNFEGQLVHGRVGCDTVSSSALSPSQSSSMWHKPYLELLISGH